MGDFVKAAGVSDIKNDCGAAVDLQGKSVAIFNSQGKFYAIDNMCKHRGGPLGEGSLDGNVVTCPWHGWQFDITNGQCLTNPSAQALCSYPVKVEGNDILVDAH